MRGPRTLFRALPVRIALLIGLALAVLLPAGLELERVLADRLLQSRVTDLEAALGGEIAAMENRFRLAEVRGARLAHLIGIAADQVDRRDAADFDRATRRAPDGSTRQARPIDPTMEAVLWVPPNQVLDLFWKGVLQQAQKTVGSHGSGTLGDTADDVWFMTPAGAEIMYIPGDPDYANRPLPEAYDVSAWIDPVRPENNPGGRPRWMPPQRSPRPPIWFATLLAPVLSRGRLIGAAGLDFSIGGLFSQVARSPAVGNGLAIVDPTGLIIHGAGPQFDRALTDSMTVQDLPRPLGDSIGALIERTRQAAPATGATASVGSQLVLARRVAPRDWTVITLIERATVVAPLEGPLRVMRITLVSILGLLLIAILAAVATDVRRQRSVDEVKARERQLEAQLLQSQKLEAVGRLAGGVAHDFNNLLTAVIGYGELLAATMEESDERRQDVGEILNAARRGATLTKQLLGFARQQNAAPRVVDVNEVIHGIERMLKPLIGEQVTITTDLDPTIGTVIIDPGQLEQIVTNLAVNARDAMVGGGTLTLRTRDDGSRVVLSVADTGLGIPDEIKAHIFEPFFTTKEVGKGTGLGLATCYGIVRQAGGTIRCESTVGRGTTFTVSLPRSGERADRPQHEAVATVATGNKGRRILVVEDDEMVRAITTAILEDEGYHVVARDGPSPALAYLLEAPESVDLVVSDIVMPRMSGPAFGRVLATTHPSLPMLFISGYNPDEATRNDLSGLGHPLLPKPFSREDLLRAVARGLEATAPSGEPEVAA